MNILRTINSIIGRINLRIVRFPGHMITVVHEGVQYPYDSILLFRYAPWLLNQEFQAAYVVAKGNTLVDIYRCYELYSLVKEIAYIEGDILEIGVWRGGTGVMLASAAKKWKHNCTVHLCDTFSGVVKAGSLDSRYQGGEHADTSIDHVKSLLDKIQLENCEVHKGIFPEQAPTSLSKKKIALCHIDVDVYQSALDIVNWVKSRMATGAVLVFDDYGFHHCDGITRLVNELNQTGEWFFFYNLNGHAILVKK